MAIAMVATLGLVLTVGVLTTIYSQQAFAAAGRTSGTGIGGLGQGGQPSCTTLCSIGGTVSGGTGGAGTGGAGTGGAGTGGAGTGGAGTGGNGS